MAADRQHSNSALTNGQDPSPKVSGVGVMANLVRGCEWSKTPLGPIEGWSSTLLSTVNMILSNPNPMQLFWGPEFVVLYNDALLPLMSGKHPQALGMRAEQCWSEAWSIVGPQMQEVFETGQALSFEESVVPIHIEGQLSELYWDYSYSPCFGPDGTVEGVIDIAQDVTANVRANAGLRASEARAKRVLRSIGDAVIVTDADANVTSLNPIAERLTGWSESEAHGHPLEEVFPIINEETRKAVENPAEKVKRLGHAVGLANHTILTRKDGGEVHIDDSAAPICADDDSLLGIVLVFRDIDERRAAERERDALAARLNQVLDDTNDSIFTIDRSWVITYMNPTAKKVASPARRRCRQELLGGLPGLPGTKVRPTKSITSGPWTRRSRARLRRSTQTQSASGCRWW